MIAWTRTTAGLGISWLPSDGTGSIEPLTNGDGGGFQWSSSWSPDGRTLAFFQLPPESGVCCEIGTLPVSSSGRAGPAKLLFGQGGGSGDALPEISPDGHWMAYQSVASGTPQIYVVPFPGPGGKWQISVTGGANPRRSKAARELFFSRSTNTAAATPTLVEVPYTVEGNSFQPGKPEVLFQGGFQLRDPFPSYDVAPDGKHFAMFAPEGGNSYSSAAPTVVINGFERVAQFVGGQK
jgi:hypothetical protein